MTTEEKNTRTAESIRMQELVDLRGEHSRVFLMSDGTEQAVFYPAGSVQNEDVSNEESETGEATLLAAADTAVMLTAAADGTEDGSGDPSTVVEDSASLTVYAWADGVMSESGTPGVGLQTDGTVTRAYFHVALPVLPRNPRIKKAELQYRYNREGQLTEKRLLPAGGQPVTVGYTHPETGDGLVQFTAGGRSVTTGS